MENEDSEVKSGERKCRERKKHLLRTIKKQIEFYFGDANLRHDRFLRKAIVDDSEGYVQIAVIASFNKMKQISNDINLIVKAIQRSELLEISKDKLRVKRRLPLPEPENTDDRTIYVESLPPFADQDWLREVFSSCGTVEYISLPRYKTTKDIKGFAFIEYASAEDAEKACQVLNSVAPKINKHFDGTNSCSTVQTSLDNKESANLDLKKGRQKRKRHKSESFSDSDTDCRCFNRHSLRLPCTHKRRRCNSESASFNRKFTNFPSHIEVCHEVQTEASQQDSLNDIRRLDLESQDKDIIPETNLDSEENISSAKEEVCVTQSTTEDKEDNDESSKKKHKRKRKRNKKAKEEKQIEIPHLHVMPKKEWVRLKMLYKNLQRDETKVLKLKMNKEKHMTTEEATENSNGKNCNENTKNATKPMSIPVVSGTILQVMPIDANQMLTKKGVKEELDGISSVAYIDVRDGDCQGYIRMKDVEAANALVKSVNEQSGKVPLLNIRCLTKAEEESYCMKIDADRKKKFSEKPQKKRGLDKVKIKKKVQVAMDDALNGTKREHIHFDDDE